MTQVAVRLDDEELATIDRLVAEGRFPSRAAAIRAALAGQRREETERAIEASYALAYGRAPAEPAGAVAAPAIAVFYRDEPPWDDPA